MHRLLRAASIQRKVAVGPADDEYEREADRVAAQVMRMPEPQGGLAAQRAPQLIQRVCAACEEELQAKHASDDHGPVSAETESYLTLGTGGEALPHSARAYFEPRFGHDFGNVRVHIGNRAAQASDEIGARAFTMGPNIYFARGEYAPGTDAGDRLLGHELTHVVQQGAAAGAIGGASFRLLQRQEPVTTVTFGAVVAKCIIGAIVGVLFDAAIQAALASWRRRSWRFWETRLDWCSIILSAVIGCFAGPVSAYLLEPWIAARLGPVLGGLGGTLLGKILLFIAKKIGMAIPKGIVGKLAKLNCISPEQSAELGVPVETLT